MPIYLLMAMQAAGMVTDYLGTHWQSRLMGMGANLEEAGINSNIEQVKLEAEDASLQSMIQLRKSMGTQIAAYAARGTATGAGSALTNVTESISNFNEDEKMRRMNAMGKVNQLRGGAAMSRLNYMSDISKLWQGFGERTFKNLSSHSKDYAKAFGITEAK